MERHQYMQDLFNQGLTDEEIFAKLDEFDNQEEPPKKKKDPVKTETNMGSFLDMVSSSEGGSSESQGTNNWWQPPIVETKDNKDLELKKLKDDLDYAIKYRPGKTYDLSEKESIAQKIVKEEERNFAEDLVNKVGRKVMTGGSITERNNFYESVNNVDSRYFTPEVFKTRQIFNDVVNEEFGMGAESPDGEYIRTERTTSGMLSGVFGTPGRNLANKENVFDIAPVGSDEYKSQMPWNSKSVIFSFDGSKPDDFGGVVLDMEDLKAIHLSNIADAQYKEDIKNAKSQKQYTQEILSNGLFLLTDYQRKYKEIKDEYENPNTSKERKLELKKSLEEFEFGKDLYGKGGTISEFKKDKKETKEQANLFADIYNWDNITNDDNKVAHNKSVYEQAEKIASTSTKEELELMLGKSYSRLKAISKDFVAYIDDLKNTPNAEQKLIESRKKDFNDDAGLTAFALQMNIPQRALLSIKDPYKSIEWMAKTGSLPKDFDLMPGDHPYSEAWNNALSEFIALNRAIQINVNPLTTEKDQFWAGAFQSAANKVGKLGISSGATEDKVAKSFTDAITNADPEYLSPEKTKERLTSTTRNAIGSGTVDLAAFAAEMWATRKLIPGLNQIKKIPKVIQGLDVAKNSNKWKKAINFTANLAANSADEALVFGSSTAIFGGSKKEVEEAALFGASMGIGNTLVGGIGLTALNKYMSSSPIARKVFKYYTAERLSRTVQGAAAGSIVFNAINMLGDGAPKKSNGEVDSEKVLESLLEEFAKMVALGAFTGVPKDFKNLTQEIKEDIYTLQGRDALSEEAAKRFNIDHKKIDNNEDNLLDEIENIRIQKTKELSERVNSGELPAGEAKEKLEEINNDATTLSNRYEINQFKLRYESEKKNKLVANENELATIANKMLSGEKLTPVESEYLANTPLSAVMNSIGARGKRILKDNNQVKFFEVLQQKETDINTWLDHSQSYKTQRGSRERQEAYNNLSELWDSEYELERLKAKDAKTKADKSRIGVLEEQIEDLRNGERFKELQEIIQLGNVERYNKDIQSSREVLKATEQGELIEVESESEFNKLYEEYSGVAADTEGFNNFGFYDRNTKTFYVNKELALKEKRVTTGKHETFHFVLRDVLKDENGKVTKEGKRIIDNMLEELTPEQRALVSKRVNESYARDNKGRFIDSAEYYEEYVTVLSEMIANNQIQFREEIGKALNPLTFLFRKKGFENLELGVESGKELFNLIKTYSKNEDIGIEKAKEISKIAEETKTSGVVQSKVYEGVGVKDREVAYSREKKEKDTVLEAINNLIPENIQTQADLFSDARTFTKIYNAIDQDGGVINNYIKSRSSSAAEAELAIESVKDRLMNFDPQAKRKDGSTIGREGFGEFIFANTAFGKLDAKKKLYEESQRKAQETSIDESVKQIADVPEATTEETTFEKRKAVINPLKFTGAPEKVTLSDKPGKGLTFKNVGKKYAGEVGEQILGIPAKKITEASANLGSVNEARAIQQFFFKADNLEKFLKILPETNIALPEAKIGLETLDVSKQVKGTGLGIPKRVLDYFYEDFIDPTGKLTSPKGRSKGLTSQVPVKRLKQEFRGTISNETVNKLKRDIGITPRGELNILPKGELRSPIGQLLKGLAKTYSTLAANTLVRQELQAAGATKQEVADIASGKRDVMLSKEKRKEVKEDLDFDLIKELATARSFKDALKALEKKGFKVGSIDEIKDVELTQKEIEEIIVEAGITLDEFKITKFTNFGVDTVYGEFKDGAFRKFSAKEKQDKGKEKLKYKYYALKNNQYEKVPIKRNPKGELIEDIQKADEIKKSRPNDFLPGRSDVYYGVEDPAYKRALKLASNNLAKENKAKKVPANSAGTEKANEQFKVNIESLEEMTIKLADAVHNKGVSIDAAIKFITKAYQATSGLIKISAPFKYASKRPKYAGQYGKKNQNEGELFREEHTVPASTVGAYLIYAVHANAAKPIMEIVKKNYFQVLLGKQYDVILDKAKLDASLPEGYTIYDDPAIRMLMANVLTENIKDLPRMDFNDQINLETGKSWAEEIGVVLQDEYITRDNLNLQNRLLLDVVTGKGEYTNHQEYLNKYIKLEGHKAAEFNNKNLKGVVSASREKKPSNKQIITELSNRDKALRNAKNAKAERKGITVFDFDDTLAESSSLVGVTMPDGEFFKIDATRFAKEGEALLEQGAEFDFSDFSRVVDGKPGPLISKLEKAISKFGNKDVYVLTARPANSATAIHEFLKGLGYELPLENITGLANSSPEAKANWMVEKAALGYNDFYFVDDAYKNVKAVQDAMSVLDVKSKERIVYKDRFDKLDKEFNDILEAKTGIGADKEYSDAKAEVVGVGKGKFKFFIPPSADDFVGLLYSTLSKGKLGENQMAWYKKNLLDPYTRAMNNISNERMSLAADYKTLKKQLGIVPKKLRDKVKGEGFTKEQAVRIYIWNKQGFDVPGLSKTDLAEMTKYVEKNSDLQVFADQLIEITKGDGYAYPGETWLAGSITTDLLNTLQVTKRAKHLEEWQANVDVIFSKKNLNKIEAAYGTNYRRAMENMLTRMKTGKNRNFDGDSLTGRFLDWLNGSTGAIMFFNTRSAVLQTISAVNFINWSDNNIFKASAAFANQPQYWKDFVKLFNSDFLRERRDNLTININESDIAEMANKGGAKGAISYILQKGFLPTQFADSFAIASGGATFYRNRIKTYLKEGMSQKEAEEKAFDDFREATEESQQSSRPDRISQQQAGPLGRVVLAFANTPSQYARIIKKASMDLAAGRGDIKTNLSKIMYYSVVQGFIFSALQSALFAADFDDEEEMDDKIWRMGNSVVDGILRGIGVGGAAATVVKNATLKTIEETEKKSPRYEKIAMEFAKLSPPVSSKLSKIQQAAREIQWNIDEVKTKGWSLENPAWLASANVLSATTNVPADRVIKKVNNIDAAINQDIEMIERMALIGGWQAWELGLDKKEKKEEKPTTYRRSAERKTIRRR